LKITASQFRPSYTFPPGKPAAPLVDAPALVPIALVEKEREKEKSPEPRKERATFNVYNCANPHERSWGDFPQNNMQISVSFCYYHIGFLEAYALYVL